MSFAGDRCLLVVLLTMPIVVVLLMCVGVGVVGVHVPRVKVVLP
jgi:hypothetical protein